VDPNGTPASFFFQYRTTTTYDHQTALQPPVSGEDPVLVKVPVTGLAPSTTYRYRLVAQAGGDFHAADQEGTFTTAPGPPPPAAPAITGVHSTEKTATSARVLATVNPRGAATTYTVEWGRTTSLGRRTGGRAVPAGAAGVPISIVLTGLDANRRYYWRLVASNAAGTTYSGRASFTTLRASSVTALGADRRIATWSRSAEVTGRVLGRGVGGITVALEQSTFPFALPFAPVATARANSSGRFSFERPIFAWTRFRAVTRGPIAVTSGGAEVRMRAKVGLRTGRRTRRAMRISGSVWPVLPTGRLSLQRRTLSGKWIPQKRKDLRVHKADRSTYVLWTGRSRRARVVRVAVVGRDNGATATGYSRRIVVPARPPARRR
jgi:hypothetical protein